MMNNIIDEIREANKKTSAVGDEIFFSDSRYRSIGFHDNLFKEIRHVESDKSVCFFDGGNVELVRMPNLSVHLVRAAFVIYQKGRKITFKRKEAHVIARFIPEKNAYSIKSIPDIIPEIAFSTTDDTLTSGNNRVSISVMGEVARRFLEIELAIESLGLLKDGDIIVRDGTLQSSITGEGRFLSELYSSASRKNITVMSLAKSCSLLTKKGNGVIAALRSIAPEGKWYYYPAVEINHPDHLAEMYFAKLHEKSKYAFRIEMYKRSRYDIDEVMSLLSENSKDSQMPGYPYGLIAVDRLAKVDEKEASVYKNKIMARIGHELESGINALNGHEWF